MIEVPTIPLGIITLLAFFGPYAVAALNGALRFVTEPWQRKLVSIVVAVVLAGLVAVLYIALGGELPAGGWAALLIWGVVVVAASYALVTKPSAAVVERSVSGDGFDTNAAAAVSRANGR